MALCASVCPLSSRGERGAVHPGAGEVRGELRVPRWPRRRLGLPQVLRVHKRTHCPLQKPGMRLLPTGAHFSFPPPLIFSLCLFSTFSCYVCPGLYLCIWPLSLPQILIHLSKISNRSAREKKNRVCSRMRAYDPSRRCYFIPEQNTNN